MLSGRLGALGAPPQDCHYTLIWVRHPCICHSCRFPSSVGGGGRNLDVIYERSSPTIGEHVDKSTFVFKTNSFYCDDEKNPPPETEGTSRSHHSRYLQPDARINMMVCAG
jgi:hypothetical protein